MAAVQGKLVVTPDEAARGSRGRDRRREGRKISGICSYLAASANRNGVSAISVFDTFWYSSSISWANLGKIRATTIFSIPTFCICLTTAKKQGISFVVRLTFCVAGVVCAAIIAVRAFWRAMLSVFSFVEGSAFSLMPLLRPRRVVW